MKRNRVIKICDFCQKEFFVPMSIRDIRRHCSRACHYSNKTPLLPQLTDRQQEILTGCLLGDGHLEAPRKTTHNSRFRKGQKTANATYQKALYRELSPYSMNLKPYQKKTGLLAGKPRCDIEYVFYTCNHPVFTELRNQWYRDSTKVIPDELRLTPLCLAYWFCDDGYIGENNAHLCTHCFREEEVSRLEILLNQDLNLPFHIRPARINSQGDQQYVLFLGSNKYETFIELIRPHIPWKCMRYKLRIIDKKWKWHT